MPDLAISGQVWYNCAVGPRSDAAGPGSQLPATGVF